MIDKLYIRTAAWTAAVLALSFSCYLPMLLKNNGIRIPEALIYAKYLFVIVPLAVSVIFSLRRGIKKWLRSLFSDRISMKPIFLCIAMGAIGLIFSLAYSLFSNDKELFIRNYPNFFSVITSGVYLFVTALAEECAWRGFLLNELSDKKGALPALIYTGITWAVWHIPMWTVRNALDFKETAIYFVWTIMVSLMIGVFFLSYKNVITAALLHMLLNMCYIAPVRYNVFPVAGIAAVTVIHFVRKRSETGEKR